VPRRAVEGCGALCWEENSSVKCVMRHLVVMLELILMTSLSMVVVEVVET
jgi:hypothetical protein